MKNYKDWFGASSKEPFIDIAIFSSDFWGHSYWSHQSGELKYVLHFVDSDSLPEELCEVAPREAAELRALIEKYGYEKENYLAVRNWAAERQHS